MSPRAAMPSEHDEQCAVVRTCALLEKRWPELALLYHPANGGHRHPAVAGKLKSEGVKRGVPDLHLPVRRDGYIGLWVELKRQNAPPSAVSPEQRAWHSALEKHGHKVVVARGADEAVRAIMQYLEAD